MFIILDNLLTQDYLIKHQAALTIYKNAILRGRVSFPPVAAVFPLVFVAPQPPRPPDSLSNALVNTPE